MSKMIRMYIIKRHTFDAVLPAPRGNMREKKGKKKDQGRILMHVDIWVCICTLRWWGWAWAFFCWICGKRHVIRSCCWGHFCLTTLRSNFGSYKASYWEKGLFGCGHQLYRYQLSEWYFFLALILPHKILPSFAFRCHQSHRRNYIWQFFSRKGKILDCFPSVFVSDLSLRSQNQEWCLVNTRSWTCPIMINE